MTYWQVLLVTGRDLILTQARLILMAMFHHWLAYFAELIFLISIILFSSQSNLNVFNIQSAKTVFVTTVFLYFGDEKCVQFESERRYLTLRYKRMCDIRGLDIFQLL